MYGFCSRRQSICECAPDCFNSHASAKIVAAAGAGIMTTTDSQAQGLISVRSAVSFAKTLANLLIALERRGMTIEARIDHAANAHAAGLSLRPTQLIIFNYPEVEGAILARCPQMGLDLPRRFLIWQDEAGGVWLGYSDPAWLWRRFGAGPELNGYRHGMANSFTGIALEAGGIGARKQQR
jgi:uncharacterized protein (DUF302 family)